MKRQAFDDRAPSPGAHGPQSRGNPRRHLIRVAVALGLLAAVYALTQALAAGRPASAPPGSAAARLNRLVTAPLLFGIYPGGAAGAVNTESAVTRPERPAARLRALERLRGPSEPFVVHLYAAYTGPEGPTADQQVGADISDYEAAGFRIELVLTYRPSDSGSPAGPDGFADFIRAAVRAFGADRGFVSVQVGDEANVINAPDTSDGYYAGSWDALISGVIAAHREILAEGFQQVHVGFNWAYLAGPVQTEFWRYLRTHGGSDFVGAVDWVGLDVYPGMWGPRRVGDKELGPSAIVWAALTALRTRYLPLAGIPYRVALHISEIGYPTGSHHSYDSQSRALRDAVDVVTTLRPLLNITEFCWFDLRDADTASRSREEHYGLMNDDYAAKPAFSLYRRLIASLSRPVSADREVFHALGGFPKDG